MSNNHTRMLERAERTFEKALSMVVEPHHRSLLADQLARVRFRRAMLPQCGLDRPAARAKLKEARAVAAGAVPLPVFLAASTALALPGGREVFRSEAVRGLGRWLLRMTRP